MMCVCVWCQPLRDVMICLSDYHEGSCHFLSSVSVLFNSFLIKTEKEILAFISSFPKSHCRFMKLYWLSFLFFRIAGFLQS